MASVPPPLRIALCTVTFPSHQAWAEGYANHSRHEVCILRVSGDRWKWRMQCDSLPLTEELNRKGPWDVIVLDGMLDASPVCAKIKKDEKTPRVFIYMHENQLTTPFVEGDRDVKHNMHWHYGCSNWRSIFCVDGTFFNSQAHFHQFSKALPDMIKQQCPKDCVDWHLTQSAIVLREKCRVLSCGVQLTDILYVTFQKKETIKQVEEKVKVPVVIWNARLEEDKCPELFLEVLLSLRGILKSQFNIIVLGHDPSHDQLWHAKFKNEFGDSLLFVGFCAKRQDYIYWLRRGDIFVSTAQHETFGLAFIECCASGILPVVPTHLCYSDVLDEDEFLYDSKQTLLTRLENLMRLCMSSKSEDIERVEQLRASVKKKAACYDWPTVSLRYDELLQDLGLHKPFNEIIASAVNESNSEDKFSESRIPIEIKHAGDDRIELYKPKSLRNHKRFHLQRQAIMNAHLAKYGSHTGEQAVPMVHGGRRIVCRMLDAIRAAHGKTEGRDMVENSSRGTIIAKPISFLCTKQLYMECLADYFKDESVDKRDEQISVYVTQKEIIDEIRGQKVNTGDAILCVMTFPLSTDLEVLLRKPPFVILDDVRNSENLGSILRTAYCLGITSVIATPTSWGSLRDTRASRCSMGNIYHLQFHLCNAPLPHVMETVKSFGIKLYGAELDSRSKCIHSHGPNRNWGLVLGNEDQGISPAVASACDELVMIPQFAGDSLNVGHATAISLFELGKEHWEFKSPN
eukprot:m.38019 g.38019  ORF g.38019 m.38019 type:complete len:742 (-) comp9382_c0_seq1:3463-5688(-)